ncbi:hypothetical protein Y032_0049g1771 [Ancylostoma ceylanicum]|uniref:Uncharacterized protein n=1 Tax=Ancylostoma ceylanicum TaxID=53326 RepID=A0A016UAB0_9BILA|nr:hypothetical protein Y032_0049g1771 [Ancylostoma ceylanicum]
MLFFCFDFFSFSLVYSLQWLIVFFVFQSNNVPDGPRCPSTSLVSYSVPRTHMMRETMERRPLKNYG